MLQGWAIAGRHGAASLLSVAMKHLTVLLAAVTLGLAPFVSAQAASYTFFGAACTTGRISPLGPVPFTVVGTPRLGMSFDVVTECTASYPWGNRRNVLLLTGASNTAIGGVRLPFDLALLSPADPFCGLLRTSSEVVLSVPRQLDYTTPSQLTFQVPNLPALIGANFYQQVLSIELSTFGPPFRAMASSRAGHGVIGL